MNSDIDLLSKKKDNFGIPNDPLNTKGINGMLVSHSRTRESREMIVTLL